MSGFLLRGLLVEYSGEFLGPIPNIVFFQFNPEQIARTIVIPEPPVTTAAAGSAREREPAQASAPPTESFTLTAHFSAADDLGKNDGSSAIPRVFGIGPQLAALEKMVYPAGPVTGLLAQAIDAIGDALSGGGEDEAPTRSTPRESVPRLLFIWGPSRILPVRITSMTLTEQKFDAFLNPVQAEVQVGLEVLSFSEGTSDKVGKGALAYTRAIKDVQAVANLAKAVETAIDVVTF